MTSEVKSTTTEYETSPHRLGLDIAFSTRAIVEILAYRDIRVINGKGGFLLYTTVQVALVILGITATIEELVRKIFWLILSPTSCCKGIDSLFNRIDRADKFNSSFSGIRLVTLLLNIFATSVLHLYSDTLHQFIYGYSSFTTTQPKEKDILQFRELVRNGKPPEKKDKI